MARITRTTRQRTAARPATRQLVVCQHDGRFSSTIDPAEISELIRQKDQLVWVDLQGPHEPDLALLTEEFGFHPLAIEDATRAHERPKIEIFADYYFLVFYALRYDTEMQRIVPQQVSLFVGLNYLVCIHAEPVAAIDETIRRWQRNERDFGADVAELLYHLLDTIVDDYFPILDALIERVEDIEEQIFDRFRPEALQEIFALKRELLMMRRFIAPERDILNVLLRREMPIYPREMVTYFQDVYDHTIRVTDSIDTYRDLLSSALDAFLSLQSNQLNEIVKILTIASIILMTAALIAGIYGMNFDVMPELHWPFGYAFALGLMMLASLALIVFFKRRRWL
ncbi:MAG: magnesium/cobalt transporter CorA [Chloroflexi bacterium]|nr:magnesium/cobalt transporter CorA [Chloroflexota bacterium]